MNNKVVRRIFKKTFGVVTKEELDQLLVSLEAALPNGGPTFSEFKMNFMDAVDSFETAFNDLEKVVEIRDRSLAVSSKEMTAMNDQIVAEGERRSAVLDRLQKMLRMLSRRSVARDATEDLESIIESVSRLIENQLASAAALQVLFEEGRKISSVLSYTGLQLQLRTTLETLKVKDPTLTLYLAGHLVGGEESAYLCCDERGQILKTDLPKEEGLGDGHRLIRVDSAKNERPLALISIECPPGSSDLGTALRQFQALVPNIAATIENIHLLKEEKLKDHLANELRTARFVQQTLMPPAEPSFGTGFDVHGYYESASECGGDWWNYAEMSDGRHLVLVGDVTGHGTASAMISAVVKGYCDSLTGRSDLLPSQILSELNRVVFKMGVESRRAMTMSVLIFDPAKKQILFSNAGHPHPIVLSNAERSSTRYLVGSGNILGLSLDSKYTDKQVPYLPGEHFILYSDGLTESINDRKEVYGDRRLLRLLGSLDKTLSAKQITQAILGDRLDFSNGEGLNDDVTTVVIKTLPLS